MTDKNKKLIGKTSEQFDLWVKEISVELGEHKKNEAYHALRSVLHTLRDRLTVEEASQLGSQLPTLIRGIYYESWVPSKTPEKIRKSEEFLSKVDEKMATPEAPPADIASLAVFKVLKKHISKGEFEDIESAMPESIIELMK
jgi:uncharacterized protein (DUF2267 family)